MWIDVKGLISRIDTAVSVKLLTHRQRRVFSIYHLVRKVAYGQVLQIDVLKNENEKKEWNAFLSRKILV